MFSYFGSKFNIARYYPAPRYPLIIEPFCGAAWYSLHHGGNVWLNDINWRVVEMWRWMIGATPEQVEALPDPEPGDDIAKFNLPRPQRMLLSHSMNKGSQYGKRTYSGWAAEDDAVGAFKRRLLQYLPMIRNWKVTHQDYRKLENIEACWFIDPPYQHSGHHYPHPIKDYGDLADWCRTRKGQVIVCEDDFADWLPFKPFKRVKWGRMKYSRLEVIWTN